MFSHYDNLQYRHYFNISIPVINNAVTSGLYECGKV